MKPKLILIFLLAFVITSLAWESHYATDKYDDNGDMQLDSEHLQLTEQSIEDLEWISSLFSYLPQCSEVKDFNSDLPKLKWNSLTTRTFCPTMFSELPDYFYSMEDYINQGNECPPFKEWIVGDCHSFTHFMGGLNSTHFPPQLRTIYEKYHQIALELRDMHFSLEDALKDNPEYSDYPQECAMEALTYESIAQHYLQDQWAMGHMWHRWGSPSIHDFPIFPTNDNSDPLEKRVNGAYATVIGAVSGLIHGWRSTVEGGVDQYLDPDGYLAQYLKNDPLSYYTEGVEWRHKLWAMHYPGTGDLYLNDQLLFDNHDRFYEQSLELFSCSRSSFRELMDEDYQWSDYEDCWDNFATNRAMYIGFGDNPSNLARVAIQIATKATGDNSNIKIQVLNKMLEGADRELARLATILRSAAENDPYDTYIAEGYTTKDRSPDKRLKLFGILPNDAYNKYPTYFDPARNAPGDPADTTFMKKLDNELFGVRQVKYFNKCHAQLYCKDTSIINDYRQKCQAGSSLDCQICEELGERFYVGNPPLCNILASGRTPDPNNPNPPKTTQGVKNWCGAAPSDEYRCTLDAYIQVHQDTGTSKSTYFGAGGNGTLSGDQFKGKWIDDSGYLQWDHTLSLTLNRKTNRITNYNLKNIREEGHSEEYRNIVRERWQMSGGNLPLTVSASGRYEFSVSGYEACNYITSLKYYYDYIDKSDGSIKASRKSEDDYDCLEGSNESYIRGSCGSPILDNP